MSFLNEDISINSIIGLGSTIRGDIKINGFVRIDGDIDGNLETTGNVIIGENARVQGNIIARSITIGGVVHGNITASDSVQLLSTSIVLGDILAHQIQAEENVIVNGHCIALSNEEAFNTAYANWQNLKTITSHSILQSVHVAHDNSILQPMSISPVVKQEEASVIEETVQDIVIDAEKPADEPAKVPTEAIPSSQPVEPASDAKKSQFIPISLGQKIEPHSEQQPKQ